MSTLAQATAAPAPVQIGDKTYQASPLTLADLGALEETVKAEYLASASRADQLLPPDKRGQIIDRALARVLGITFQSPEVGQFLVTASGVYAFIALSIRRRHPEVTAASIGKELAENPAQFDSVLNTILRVTGLGGEKNGEGPPPGEDRQGG